MTTATGRAAASMWGRAARLIFGNIGACGPSGGGPRVRGTGFTVGVIAVCQALALTGTTIMVLVSALAARAMAPSEALTTLPFGLMFVGVMVATVPASLMMRRFGRRAGFTLGAMFGAAGGLVGAVGLVSGSFVLFALGGFLQGLYAAFAQYYRFAAAEAVRQDCRASAISLVMLGGLAAAVAGPQLAQASLDLVDGARFAGCFLTIAGLAAAALAAVRFVDIPAVAREQRSGTGRPMRTIAAQPAFMVALPAAVVGYAVMGLVMTAAPLAMAGHGHGFGETAFVIQGHVLAMFAPSFFTGHLVRRFGPVRIALAGVAALFAMVGANLSGAGLWAYWCGLVLLGVGWNFMFIGASTLLTETYAEAEKAKVQGLNDFLVFGADAAAILSSGYVLQEYGWAALNRAVLPALLAMFGLALWLRLGRARRNAKSATGAMACRG